MLASASSGQALPVFGSVLAADVASGAAAELDAARDGAGAPADAGAALASVAFTCCSVRTFGGCVVTIVAVRRSPAR